MKKKSQQQHYHNNNKGAILFEGFIFKKSPSGLKGFRRWQKRWLQASENYLSYYLETFSVDTPHSREVQCRRTITPACIVFLVIALCFIFSLFLSGPYLEYFLA